MRRGIDSRDRLVEGAGDDLIVDDEDGADRHFARCQSQPGLLERGRHERVVTHAANVSRRPEPSLPLSPAPVSPALTSDADVRLSQSSYENVHRLAGLKTRCAHDV